MEGFSLRIFPPDPDVVLYETGFGDQDLFNRTETGKALSSLVDRIEDPLVIALDGQWGSGKTYFLKRWVGAHTIENTGKATTVYFDAFSNDFLDDPLIALTGVISERFPKTGNSNSWRKFRSAAAVLAKPAIRVGLAALTAGGTEVAGPVLDAMIEAGSKELDEAANEFWKKEDGRRAAMLQFRQALSALTHDSAGNGQSAQPLVVVVDELDRCRPDYALSLLEVIKHFFAVPNVHFVLGVNLTALEQSVRARYGEAFDAERYLRRFISLVMPLPDVTAGDDQIALPVEYFENISTSMGFSSPMIGLAKDHVRLAQAANSLTFRDMNRFVSRLALLDLTSLEQRWLARKTVLISMVMFRSFAPALERKAIDEVLKLDDVKKFYGIIGENINDNRGNYYDYPARRISEIWGCVISNGEIADEGSVISGAFGPGDALNKRQLPMNVAKDHLSNIHIGQP